MNEEIQNLKDENNRLKGMVKTLAIRNHQQPKIVVNVTKMQKTPEKMKAGRRPKRNLNELSQSSLKRRARATSIECTGSSKETILRFQRFERHASNIFTPEKVQKEEQKRMTEYDGLLVLRNVFTQNAYARLKGTLRSIGKQFDILPPLKKVF